MRRLTLTLIVGVMVCGGAAMNACSSSSNSTQTGNDAATDATQQDASGGSDDASEASTVVEAGADGEAGLVITEAGIDTGIDTGLDAGVDGSGLLPEGSLLDASGVL
jgi:hypothetical protein